MSSHIRKIAVPLALLMHFAVLRRLERAVVRPRKRQIGGLEVEPPARVRRRVGPTDQVALRRLEHIMRGRKKKWERETREKSVKRKVKPRETRAWSDSRMRNAKKVFVAVLVGAMVLAAVAAFVNVPAVSAQGTPTYTYVTGENVYEGGTVDFDNAKAADGKYENIFENNYTITYDNTSALAVYYDATSTPKYRIWDGTSWGAQGNCTALSGTLEWVVLKYSRTREEAILGTLDATGDIRVQFWNGSAWGATKLIANVGTTNDAYRSFDIGYENGADNAVIVFTENSAATKLRYSVWNGSTWTVDNAAINLNYPTTGVIRWVEMAANPRPDNNEMALIYGNANSDVFGFRWSGAAWDNMGATAVWDATGSTNPAAKWVDVAYESQSGSIMFMWADATATDQYWRIYENTPRVLSAATLLDISAASAIGEWIYLASDPRTDNILYGCQTNTPELEVCEWSGTAWGTSSELDAGTEDALDRNFGMTYETWPTDNVGHAWVMWGDGATVTRQHKTGSTWNTAVVVTGSDDTARVFMIAHPISGVVFSIMAQDSSSGTDDLLENDNTGGSAWGGTSFWGGPMGANPVFEGFGIAPKVTNIHTNCYRENVQHNITGISSGDNYSLEIKYYTAGDSEAVSVYLKNFTSGNWDNQGNIQGGTLANPNYFTASVDTDHISNGNVYVRYVQPVLDKYCGKCHQGKGEGRKKLDLTYRPDGLFCEPYWTLTGRPSWGAPYKRPEKAPPGFGIANMIMVEGYDQRDPKAYVTTPPMTFLSYRSKLIEIASSGKHNDVKVDPISLARLVVWVDAMCPFSGEEEIRSIPDPVFQGVDWLAIRPRIETAPRITRPGPVD